MNQETRSRIIIQAIRKWSIYAFATLLLVSLGSMWVQPSAPVMGQVLKNAFYLAPVGFASLLLMPFLIREMCPGSGKIKSRVQFRRAPW